MPPNSIKPLYPIDQVELIEKHNTNNIKIEEVAPKRQTEFKRKMPVNSTKLETKWEI